MGDLRRSTAKLSETLESLRPSTGRASPLSTAAERSSDGDAKGDGSERSGRDSAQGEGVRRDDRGDSKGSDSGGGDDGGDGDDDDDDEREPPPVPIDEKAAEILGSKVGHPLAQADDKPAPPKKQAEDANIDEYYAVFATRSRVPRTP